MKQSNIQVECTKCLHVHLFSERPEEKDNYNVRDTKCPKCGAKSCFTRQINPPQIISDMPKKQNTVINSQEEVAKMTHWNLTNKPGARVQFRLNEQAGWLESSTLTRADMQDGKAVVWLKSVARAVPLSNIKIIEKAEV